MCHARTALSKLMLCVNVHDNVRQPILEQVEDTSEGVHDLLFATRGRHPYQQLGVGECHASCADSLLKQPERRSTRSGLCQMALEWGSLIGRKSSKFSAETLVRTTNQPHLILDEINKLYT